MVRGGPLKALPLSLFCLTCTSPDLEGKEGKGVALRKIGREEQVLLSTLNKHPRVHLITKIYTDYVLDYHGQTDID